MALSYSAIISGQVINHFSVDTWSTFFCQRIECF